jgi:hypothetical protein
MTLIDVAQINKLGTWDRPTLMLWLNAVAVLQKRRIEWFCGRLESEKGRASSDLVSTFARPKGMRKRRSHSGCDLNDGLGGLFRTLSRLPVVGFMRLHDVLVAFENRYLISLRGRPTKMFFI